MRPNSAFVAVLAVVVLLSGCAGLGGEETAAPTAGPVEGTVNGGETGTDTTSEAATTTMSGTTGVATSTATRTATRTDARTSTRTSVSTATATATTAETPTGTATAIETTSATTTGARTQTRTTTGTRTTSRTPGTTAVLSRPAGLDEEQRYLVVRALGSGESYYRIYVPGSIDLGPEADTENADHEDRAIIQTETYIQGYVGDGGVDSYAIDVSPGVMVNDGNATLAVFEDGERIATLEPGAGLENGGTIAPTTLPPPNDSENVVRVEAVGGGESAYVLSASDELTLGNEADIPAEADRPDRRSRGSSNEVYGFVGDGGVDSYRTAGDIESLSNDGTATLRVFVDGELWNTVEPNGSAGDRYSAV